MSRIRIVFLDSLRIYVVSGVGASVKGMESRYLTYLS